MKNGTTAIWIGSRKRPQYHEINVKRRREAANAAGYAYRSNVFFRAGYSEICRKVMVQNQLATERTCCTSAFRLAHLRQAVYAAFF